MESVSLHELELEQQEDGPFGLVLSHAPPTWSPRMAFDIAMGEEDPEVLRERYALDEEAFDRIVAHPAFRKEVSQFMKDVRENGVTFKAKVRAQAEEYLEVVDELITDPLVGASLKLDAIKSVVKWAGLDGGSSSAAAAAANGPQFNIQINL
jgi:hypothetical protein